MERPDSKGTKQDWIDYAVALEGIQAEVLGDLTESEAEVAGLEAQLAAVPEPLSESDLAKENSKLRQESGERQQRCKALTDQLAIRDEKLRDNGLTV